jgi:hypothetical protein
MQSPQQRSRVRTRSPLLSSWAQPRHSLAARTAPRPQSLAAGKHPDIATHNPPCRLARSILRAPAAPCTPHSACSCPAALDSGTPADTVCGPCATTRPSRPATRTSRRSRTPWCGCSTQTRRRMQACTPRRPSAVVPLTSRSLRTRCRHTSSSWQPVCGPRSPSTTHIARHERACRCAATDRARIAAPSVVGKFRFRGQTICSIPGCTEPCTSGHRPAYHLMQTRGMQSGLALGQSSERTWCPAERA